MGWDGPIKSKKFTMKKTRPTNLLFCMHFLSPLHMCDMSHYQHIYTLNKPNSIIFFSSHTYTNPPISIIYNLQSTIYNLTISIHFNRTRQRKTDTTPEEKKGQCFSLEKSFFLYLYSFFALNFSIIKNIFNF
jgi:hypothetical protein